MFAAGLDPENTMVKQAVELTNQLIGIPSSLSQHVGGFHSDCRERSCWTGKRTVGNAAMDSRPYFYRRWDKDDIDDPATG